MNMSEIRRYRTYNVSDIRESTISEHDQELKVLDRYKINRIVEVIRVSGFEFETFEVEEHLDEILAFYGMVSVELTNEEEFLLKLELMKLAEQYEFREAAYLGSSEDPLIASLPERQFSIKTEMAERKIMHMLHPVSILEFLQLLSLV